MRCFFSKDIPTEKLQQFHDLLQDESYCAFVDMLILNLPKPARVSVPMLVLGAEDDAVFRPNEIRATAAAYGTEAVMFPNMAHDMMLEAGWPAVADKIIDWASGMSAEARRSWRFAVTTPDHEIRRVRNIFGAGFSPYPYTQVYSSL